MAKVSVRSRTQRIACETQLVIEKALARHWIRHRVIAPFRIERDWIDSLSRPFEGEAPIERTFRGHNRACNKSCIL